MTNLQKLKHQIQNFINQQIYNTITQPATNQQLDAQLSHSQIMRQNINQLPLMQLSELQALTKQLNQYHDNDTFHDNFPHIDYALNAECDVIDWYWATKLKTQAKPYPYDNLLFDMLGDLETICQQKLQV